MTKRASMIFPSCRFPFRNCLSRYLSLAACRRTPEISRRVPCSGRSRDYNECLRASVNHSHHRRATPLMRPRRRLSWRQFCETVEEAVASLPEPFHKYLENVVVDVQDEPSDHDYKALAERGGPAGDALLLGLFIGVPLTFQG